MKQSDDATAIQIASIPPANRVMNTIQAASKDTGVSFSYLMAQAGKESAYEAEAGSHASSAAGLFQFTKTTWLQLVKNHGAAHGIGDLADQVHRNGRGEYVVSDPKARQDILDLRRDPQLSSLMAGEYARDNKARLEKSLGRAVDSTDLYLAHFLGPAGAARVLKAKSEDPSQPAAELLPQAAHKNPSVFYDSNHTPRSVAAVYDRIHHAIDRPMRQFAQLDEPAASEGVHHTDGRHGHGKMAKADQPWPFETGQWPPAYVPATPADPAAAAAAPAAGEQVAYTDTSQSADQISAPMPPAPGAAAEDRQTPFTKLLKGLFG